MAQQKKRWSAFKSFTVDAKRMLGESKSYFENNKEMWWKEDSQKLTMDKKRFFFLGLIASGINLKKKSLLDMCK